jgi:hypothetical protein
MHGCQYGFFSSQQFESDHGSLDGRTVPVSLRAVPEVPLQLEARSLHPLRLDLQHGLQLAQVLRVGDLDGRLRQTLRSFLLW